MKKKLVVWKNQDSLWKHIRKTRKKQFWKKVRQFLKTTN